MHVLTINHSDSVGPGAKSAYRTHCALRRAGVDSEMWVNHEGTSDWTVVGPSHSTHRIVSRVAPHLAAQLLRFNRSSERIDRSPAAVPSSWLKRINRSGAKLAHLHWVQNEMLRIEELGRLQLPIVWTLHDMWPFCGTENFTSAERWRDGYQTDNRPQGDGGWDIDRWAWRRKLNSWRKPMSIVAPSQWLADAASASALMRKWPVTVIPHPIDTDVWSPVERSNARALLGLSGTAPVVAFGAWSYAPHDAGFDLLRGALSVLKSRSVDVQLLVIGQSAPQSSDDVGYPVHYAGHLHDDLSLRIAYSAADVMVVPSRTESFCETAVEAQACGTPIAAFATAGVSDVVEHQRTGYLAKAFDADDLAAGIEWVLASRDRGIDLGAQARTHAVERFSYPVVAEKLLALYRGITDPRQQ